MLSICSSTNNCLVLSNVILKWATHYSRTTTKHGWNKSFAEKIVSAWNMKTVLHTIRWSSKVSHLSLLLQFRWKILLSSLWGPLAWRSKMNRVSQNAMKPLLHTIRGVYLFVVLSWFRCGSRIVCSPLKGLNHSGTYVEK